MNNLTGFCLFGGTDFAKFPPLADISQKRFLAKSGINNFQKMYYVFIYVMVCYYFRPL